MIAPSLADPTQANAIVAAVHWIESVALGTIASSIAVICVASIGFLMLSGRVALRRGITVVTGCFLLFGSRYLASSLLELSPRQDTGHMVKTPTRSPLLGVTPHANPTAFDPYAGAAVPSR